MAASWIQIVGAKDTGKTTLIEGLTRELVARGRSVTYIKHTHVEPSLEPEDTDTARLRAVGASTTVLASSDQTITLRARAAGIEELSFREGAPGEVVLAEGFKKAPGKKIVIAGGDLDIASLDGVVAVVGAAPDGYNGPVFTGDQIAELCALIERLIAPAADSQWNTRMLVNGDEIPMNAFVQNVTAAVVKGITEVMKDVPSPVTLELRARKSPTRD